MFTTASWPKAWVAQRRDPIELFYLSSCSPQLNPEERLNAGLKQKMGKRVPVRTKAKLRQAANDHMAMLEQNPGRASSQGLAWANPSIISSFEYQFSGILAARFTPTTSIHAGGVNFAGLTTYHARVNSGQYQVVESMCLHHRAALRDEQLTNRVNKTVKPDNMDPQLPDTGQCMRWLASGYDWI